MQHDPPRLAPYRHSADRIRVWNGAGAEPASDFGEIVMNKEQIDHMVARFLSWTLPADFAPNNGISYSQRAYAPTGTNLFNFPQARAMVLHMLTGLPEGDPEFEGELSDADMARIDEAWAKHKAAGREEPA